MKHCKEEKGYALVVVLLVIVLIGIFIPLIYSALLSTSIQIKKTEETLHHNNLADMGVTLFETAVINNIEEWEFPEGWVPPPEWNSLDDNVKLNNYITPLIIQSLQTNLMQLVTTSPQFKHGKHEFGITTFTIDTTLNKIRLNVYSTLDGGANKVYHEREVDLPIIKIN